MRINLTDKYKVMDTTDCRLNSAQCERIDKYCICHCYPGYSIINGSCLKGKLCRTYVLVHIDDCYIVVYEFKEVCFTLNKLESV